MAFFIDLKGEWWNVEQITKIEKRTSGSDHGIPYVVTLSDGSQRGIAEEEFRKIMVIANAPHQ